MKTLTEAAARRLSYRLIRGAYYGACDSRADRWYLDRLDSDVIDRRGDGHRTKREALEALTEHLAADEVLGAQGPCAT